MDEADNLTRRPDAVLRVAVEEHLPPAFTTNKGRDFLKVAGGALALDPESLFGNTIAIQAGGIAPTTQEEGRVCLLGGDDGLLDGLVNRGLDGAEKPCAHIYATGAEAQSGSKPVTVGKPPGSNKWYRKSLPRPREENKIGDVGFANMPGDGGQ